jgi:hypothetical protein
LDEKVEQALEKKMQGGAIRKARKKSPKKDIKIEEALEKQMQGGAIRKARKKSPKKNEKVEQALEKQMQGGRLKKKGPKFFGAMHKHLHQNLSGRGGRFDSAFVREKMHQVMSQYHPSIFQSYLSGKVRDIPHDPRFDLGKPAQPTRRDPKAHVIDSGGSLNGITHSENGFLQSYDSSFYSHYEIV